MAGVRITSFTIRGAGDPMVVAHAVVQFATPRRHLFHVDEFRVTDVLNDQGELTPGFALEMSTTPTLYTQEAAARIAIEIQKRAELRSELMLTIRSKRIVIPALPPTASPKRKQRQT